MVEQITIKKVGGSKFLIVPSEFIRVFKLDEFIYHIEVSTDGKTITYQRMKKIEEKKC